MSDAVPDFDPLENSARLRSGIEHAALGRAVYFSPMASDRILVVFADPVDRFIAGRVRVFQQVVYDEVEAFAEIVGVAPGCMRVFFSLDLQLDEVEDDLLRYFSSEEFSVIARNLGVLYVQFRRNSMRLLPSNWGSQRLRLAKP